MWISRIFFFILVAVLVGYIVLIVTPPSKDLAQNELVRYCLEQTGVEKASWSTVISYASEEDNRSPAQIWAIFSDVNDWPTWSKPQHVSAEWITEDGWVEGGQFTQQIDRGFPLGVQTSKETIREVRDDTYAAWWKKENGVSSCHVWFFEQTANGTTQVTTLEVQDGIIIGLMKPLVEDRWQYLAEESLFGLLRNR